MSFCVCVCVYVIFFMKQFVKELTFPQRTKHFYFPAEDAVLAVEHGASGILVSNHGGRQLDGVPATVNSL